MTKQELFNKLSKIIDELTEDIKVEDRYMYKIYSSFNIFIDDFNTLKNDFCIEDIKLTKGDIKVVVKYRRI